MKTIEAQLRRALERDGRSLNELGAASGVDKGILSRFLRDQRGMNLRSADALCRALGLDVRLVKRQRKAV